jgi:hypothetical protein
MASSGEYLRLCQEIFQSLLRLFKKHFTAAHVRL